jgi:hypothetical protein
MEELMFKPLSLAVNETIPMTRRTPKLKQKVLERDSEVARKLIHAWDVEGDKDKVLQIFIKNRNKLSDERYWELLKTVWLIAGSIETSHHFYSLFTSNRPCFDWFCTKEEREFLRNLPNQFTVYRVCDEENDGGFSWTLDRTFAEMYQKANNRKLIIERNVWKGEVFAYLDRRAESEILIIPEIGEVI